jgi:hypothetical protein
MLAFLDVVVQVAEVVEPGCAFVVLNNGQFTRLRKPPKLAGTHSEVLSSLFGPQQTPRDVITNAH